MPRASLPRQWLRRRTATVVFLFGIVLNLVSFGLVAAATTGVFYGLGFSLLEHRNEIARLDIDRSTKADPLLREIFPRLDSEAPREDREAGSGTGEPEISRLAAPILPFALTQEATAHDVVHRRNVDVAPAKKPAQAQIAAPATEIIVAQWGIGYSLEDAQKQVLQTNVAHGRQLF